MLYLQELQSQRVERAQGQAFGGIAFQALAQTLAHFLGGLVGEGDCGNALGRHAAGRDQVCDLFDDDPGLAAAGTGQDQQGSLAVHYCVALGRIESVHAEMIRSGPAVYRRGLAMYLI